MIYSVINIGNVPDGQGGYEFNDAHYTGKELEFDNPPTIREAVSALKKLGMLTQNARASRIERVEEDTCESITLRLKRKRGGGQFLYELRPVRQS